jgi:plasmid maintenance system killer protein
MRFRLSAQEVRWLYSTGSPGRYPSEVITGLFGTLEAIEAAPSMADLEALASVVCETLSDGRVSFGLPSGWCLEGQFVTEEGAQVLALAMTRDVLEGGQGG